MLPAVTRRHRMIAAGATRRPRFRRSPFERDVASDPGTATPPRVTVAHMLPSAVLTASASAMSSFRGSIPHPTRSLCTLRSDRRQPPRNTHYQAGATRYLSRTSTGWSTPASPGALRPLSPKVVRFHPDHGWLRDRARSRRASTELVRLTKP